MTLGLCINRIFDSISYIFTSYTHEQVGGDVADEDNYHSSYYDDDYMVEEFDLSETDLGSFSMSLSLSMSMTNEEELVQETGGEMRLRGAAKHDVYKAIS